MKFHAFWLAACLLTSLSLHAQSSLPVDGIAVDSVSTSSNQWFFQQLSAQQTGNTVTVRGRLKPGAGALPSSSGHVDIAMRDAQGKLLAETTADYFPGDARRARLNNGAQFTAHLTVALPAGVLPAGSAVKVAFHRSEPRPSGAPVHSQNIAR